MKIKCLECGHYEDVNLAFFIKIIGGATAGFGFWAWVSFLFAGTGFAMAICIAIIAGGAAMLAYKNEILDWIVNKGYSCKDCGNQSWVAVSPEIENEINARDVTIASLKKDADALKVNLDAKEKAAFDYIQSQDSSFSMEDVEHLLNEIEDKDNRIETLLKDKKEWDKHKESLITAQQKIVINLEKRFKTCYSLLSFSDHALKRIAVIPTEKSLKLERQFGFLQHNPKNANFRDDIMGTDVKELGFDDDGRIYIRKVGSHFTIVCVGNKASQANDIKYIKRAYKNG